jgi:hypothetical protein
MFIRILMKTDQLVAIRLIQLHMGMDKYILLAE